MGKDRVIKAKKSPEPAKASSPKAINNPNKSKHVHDDSNASMSVDSKSPRKHTGKSNVSNEDLNEIAEEKEKLANAEATLKRVRGNVKKRKFRENSLPEPLKAPVDLGTRLYIGNLSPNATNEDVTKFFEPIGKVVYYQAIVPTNKDLTTRPNAFSFVTLESLEAANKAIAELNGKSMANHPSHSVQVKKATPKTNKNKKSKTDHPELPKKVEKKVEKQMEKVEKKLDKAEKKIEKADKKVEKVEKRIEKDQGAEKVEKAEKKAEKAVAKVNKAVHKVEKAESKVEKQYKKAEKKPKK